jgi:hypothetical protein
MIFVEPANIFIVESFGSDDAARKPNAYSTPGIAAPSSAAASSAASPTAWKSTIPGAGYNARNATKYLGSSKLFKRRQWVDAFCLTTLINFGNNNAASTDARITTIPRSNNG